MIQFLKNRIEELSTLNKNVKTPEDNMDIISRICECEYLLLELHKMNLLKHTSSGNLAEVQKCIEQGADIEATDNHGETVLIIASYNGDLDIVKYLLKNGADINAKTNFGWSALKAAKEEGNLKIVEYLKSKGAKL